MPDFNADAASALFDALQSYAQKLGLFQAVETNEPPNAPGNRLYCSIVLGNPGISPDADKSGLAAVSGTISFKVDIWSAAMQRPLASIDKEALTAAAAFMGALAGGFTLGGEVRNIDLFRMTAATAWAEFQGKQFRVISVNVPAVVNDLWTEAD